MEEEAGRQAARGGLAVTRRDSAGDRHPRVHRQRNTAQGWQGRKAEVQR